MEKTIIIPEGYEALRDNYKKCNRRWKPSDEQMDAIQYVSNFDYGGHRKALESLYNDLKKLCL